MEFLVLGPLEVRRDEAVLPLGGPGQRSLLANLILRANEVVGTDRLIDLLWGDEPPDSALHILRVQVSRLRKVLEADPSSPTLLVTSSPGYVLRTPAETVDATRFETLVGTGRSLLNEDPGRASGTLAQALALWRGGALADLALEPFAAPEIARLEELRLLTIEDRMVAELALGHHQELVGDLRKLASEHPLRERITQLLMMALYRSGRQTEALASYHDARSRLTSELGIDPGSTLQALERAVLQHDPSLDLPVNSGPESRAKAPVTDPQQSDPATQEVRKTVTLVFCDVAGSTALGESLDPETLRRVMQRYFETMRICIERHGGTVEKFVGDAVMAIFGVPQVHEDDAMRAVRAAADMRSALTTLNEDLDRDHGMSLACRIGVNTGEVVAGSGDQAIVTGGAVNVAARLEQVAAEGEILLGESTFALVRDAVLAEPTDPLELKGKAAAVSAYRLIEVTPRAAGFARHLDAPIVGRERELALIRSTFERTVTDQACQLFTVFGTAGVGKSRLIAAFVEELPRDVVVLRGRCLPYGEGITFNPLVEALIDVAHLKQTDTPEAARAKLATLSGPHERADRVAECVAQAIGISGSETSPEETLWAIRVLLESLASERPLVFAIDDLQWAEPKFLELVEHVVDFAQDSPILLACMARPEMLDDLPDWAGGKLNATSILLAPLSLNECGTLVANLLADDAVDEGVRTRIAGAAEGNPLFAEEITGLLVEEGRLVLKEGRWVANGELADVPVPTTISALLATRLERLPQSERRLIEIGAVMGQVFYSDAVRRLANDDPSNVEVGLISLVRKQFVRPEHSDLPVTDALVFRHLLIRDTAYDAIPKVKRAVLHERFADWYDNAAGLVGEKDEILGYHLEQAHRYRTELGRVDHTVIQLGQRAGEHLGEAGLRAFARGDMSASTGLLDRATRILPSDHPRLPRLEDRLFMALVLYGELERAAEVNDRLLRSARLVGDRSEEQRAELFAVELRMYRDPQNLTAGEMRRCAHRAIEVFEGLGNDEGLVGAHSLLAEAAQMSGQATIVLDEAERALVHARRSRTSISLMSAVLHVGRALFMGPTPAGVALHRLERLADDMAGNRAAEAAAIGNVGWFLSFLGRFDEARQATRHQLSVSEELGNRIFVAFAISDLSQIEWLAGDPPAAEEGLRGLCTSLRNTGDDLNLADAVVALAELLVVLGRDDEALEQTDDIQSIASPDVWIQGRWRATRSVALAHLGRLDEAVPMIDESERLMRSTDFVPILADTMLAKAEVLKVADQREAAAIAAGEALALYEAKEFVPHISWAKSMLESLAM